MASTRLPRAGFLARSLQHPICPYSVRIPVQPALRRINTTAPSIERDALPDSLLTTPPQTATPSPAATMVRPTVPASSSKIRTPKVKAGGTLLKEPLPAPLPSPISMAAAVAAVKQSSPPHSPRYALSRAPTAPSTTSPGSAASTASSAIRAPLTLSPSLQQHLPFLATQPPFYITVHIHGKPYLVTAGDTVRLPFLMHGVLPGDILRLDRASVLGSRDWTLKAGAATPSSSSSSTVGAAELTPATTPAPIVGRTDGLKARDVGIGAGAPPTGRMERESPGYLDDRLFVCRAVVMGTESEPMRIKEKTKQRNRHVRKVKSKHRYTILKIREVTVNAAPLV